MMNLLVTNTRNAQAYAIIRALRPHADKIVVTMEGDYRLSAWFSHAARSCLVDRRYFTPSPATDWRAGRIQRENTEIEERYIQAILRICEEEKVDTIFPSFDPHVYVFSKNKERFENLGILIPVPDYEVVITPLDKYRTIKAAEELGFPCPKTYLPESEEELKQIAEELGFPLVIKPRFTAAGRETGIVMDFQDLLEKTGLMKQKSAIPMIQEYIQGRLKLHFYLVVDTKGQLKVSFYTKDVRNIFRVFQNLPTAMECLVADAFVTHAAILVREVGWWGGTTVEAKIDPRDGIPKLMEMNPRIGAHLWYRTEHGINEPLMCLRIAKGEEVETANDYPVGAMLLDPEEDLLGLGFNLLDILIYKIRVGIRGKAPVDPLNPPLSLKELIESYKQTYFTSKMKVYNPYFRYFFQEPLVSILWWSQFFTSVLRATKQLGR